MTKTSEDNIQHVLHSATHARKHNTDYLIAITAHNILWHDSTDYIVHWAQIKVCLNIKVTQQLMLLYGMCLYGTTSVYASVKCLHVSEGHEDLLL